MLVWQRHLFLNSRMRVFMTSVPYAIMIVLDGRHDDITMTRTTSLSYTSRVQNLSALLREPGRRWKELIGQQCLNVEHGVARGRTNAWRSGGAAPLAGSYISSRVWCEQPQAAGGRHWRIEGGWRQMVRAPGWNCMSWEVKVLELNLNFLLQKSTGDVCISLKT